MILKSIEIDGFKKFKNQPIEVEQGLTVFAGANNSGKTSLVDLFGVVFGGSKLSHEDFEVAGLHKYASFLISLFQQKIKKIENHLIEEKMKDFPAIQIKLQIDYDPETEDFGLFADYLMELDEESKSFYFVYEFKPDIENLIRNCQEEVFDETSVERWEAEVRKLQLRNTGSKVKKRLSRGKGSKARKYQQNEKGGDVIASLRRSMVDRIKKAYVEACEEHIYFSDARYKVLVPMDPSEFRKLFHFKSIKAGRDLDDAMGDRRQTLSDELVKVAKRHETWKKRTQSLPADILKKIEETGVRNITREAALESLQKTIESIDATKGNLSSTLMLDLDFGQSEVDAFIGSTTQARYGIEGASLGEKSQGLGYSNLIYLHLAIEDFIYSAKEPQNQNRVSLFVVEEPESHMHPQMQSVFMNHLKKRFENNQNIQAIITTHSSEIVRLSSLENLRLLQKESAATRVVDLRKFYSRNVDTNNPEKRRLYNLLYRINFADIMFADKLIVYEGDTERMYIQALIEEDPTFASLRHQYISYIQVGGAYAHVYRDLFREVKIPTIIFTDIDYKREDKKPHSGICAILNSPVGNSSLRNFLGVLQGEDLFVKDIYSRLCHNTGVVVLGEERAEPGARKEEGKEEGNIAVSFQSEVDGYARTLEEAIFSKILNIKVFEKRSRAFWRDFKDEKKLVFPLSRKHEITIVDAVNSVGDEKTDFMYSLILQDDFKSSAPEYIVKGLQWLAK